VKWKLQEDAKNANNAAAATTTTSTSATNNDQQGKEGETKADTGTIKFRNIN
jgi:hypothetical protein